MSNKKAMIINLIAGLITMMLHKSESRDINVKVDLSYYETKADLKMQQLMIHLS